MITNPNEIDKYDTPVGRNRDIKYYHKFDDCLQVLNAEMNGTKDGEGIIGHIVKNRCISCGSLIHPNVYIAVNFRKFIGEKK